jgi:hypothetical protein
VTRWLVSTPQTIAVCNRPEILGQAFSYHMLGALTSALACAPFRSLLEGTPSSRLCIMNFLRGGLNFDLRNALADSLGSNCHGTCFMSSQRFRKDGRWHVKEDMYRKMKVPDGAVLLVGDVVATGVTVGNGFQVLEEYLASAGSSLKGVVFFTIGCHKLEKMLEPFHARFSERFAGYRGTHVVYMEGKLKLVDSATRLMIAIQGTDLIKLNALLAPEFEMSQYDSLAAPLERCAIYDAGSRAFDVVEYLGDVIHYWEQVRLLAKRGHSLTEALKERWPEKEYSTKKQFMAEKRAQWHGLPAETLDMLWSRRRERWTSQFRTWANTSDALESVCDDRLNTLTRILNDAGGKP